MQVVITKENSKTEQNYSRMSIIQEQHLKMLCFISWQHTNLNRVEGFVGSI
jgi:hypothetical protein